MCLPTRRSADELTARTTVGFVVSVFIAHGPRRAVEPLVQRLQLPALIGLSDCGRDRRPSMQALPRLKRNIRVTRSPGSRLAEKSAPEILAVQVGYQH
jgi:hypothetical protein